MYGTPIQRRLWTHLLAILLLFPLLAAQAQATTATGGREFRYGTVATRGLVLSANGNPIWVAYDSNGEKVAEFGEATGEYANAEVMSAAAYTALMLSQGRPDPQLADNIQSVLVGKGGTKLEASEYNIGYWTEFYTTEGIDKTWWGPVEGALITAFDGRTPTMSDEDGSYVVSYYIPPCPCFTMPYDHWVHAQVRYEYFNPKSDQLGSYYVSRPAYDYCSGYSACPTGYTLEGMLAKLAVTSIEGDIALNTYRHLDIPVDVAVLSGKAYLENTARTDIDIEADLAGTVPQGDTRYAFTRPEPAPTVIPEDFDGDGVADTTRINADGSVDVWFAGSDPAEDPPDITRVADTAPDLFDRGLLASLSAEDRQNTDVYVYRVSNDQLISFRRGLGAHELDGDQLIYRFLFRGPGDAVNTSARDLEAFQAKSNLNPSLRGYKADHLRTGEKIKVIMINRASGYIGSAVGTYGENTAEGLISFTPPAVVMRPPNLKIKAKRKFEVQSGLGKGEEREYLIGFEGSGLTSDAVVVVTSEWTAWDGSALPEDLPGFTGRLAQVVEENTLGQGSSQIANFEIKPGLETQLVRLPMEEIDRAHFYLNVSGEPIDRNPDFSQTGAGEGPLVYRPRHFVPIQVPLFDEAATLELGQSDPDAEAQYQWVYRPEMQFSLFDLELELNPELEQDPDQPVAADTILPYSYGNNIDFLYTLLEDQLPLLDPFGAGRTLVFGYLDNEYDVPLGEIDQGGDLLMGGQNRIQLTNISALNNLDADDLVTISLYQKGDAENVLWEYTSVKIEVEVEHPETSGCRIIQGETLTLLGKTRPAGRALRWSINKELTDENVRVDLISLGSGDASSCLLRPHEDTGTGYLWVRATDVEAPHIFVDAAIQVGCGCVECVTPGKAKFKLGSVNTRFSLGKTKAGLPAGDLFIKSDAPTAKLATPEGLILSSLNMADLEVLSQEDQRYRQILAPQTLVDIVPSGGQAFELRFYPPSAISGTTDGIYEVAGSPQVTYRIAGAAASLAVTETRDGQSKESAYSWIDSTWQLSQGDGSKITTRSETISGIDRIVIETLTNAEGDVAENTQTTYHSTPFGQVAVETITDPGGLALTTTNTYYEDAGNPGSYGRLATRIAPDGSWTRYHYDTKGRTSLMESGWLDLTATSAPGSARVTAYTYTPVDGSDAQAAEDQNRPRTVTEQIHGITVARTYFAYLIGADGYRTRITERCADPAAAYGDPGNLRTVTTFYPSDSAEEGRIQSVQSPDEGLSTYTYRNGTWNGTSFSAGTGKAVQTTLTFSTAASPEGLAHRTTREITVQDEVGNSVRQETQVFTGSGYETLSWTLSTYDHQGHQTATSASDGTTTTSTWACCGKESETDARGIQTAYTYDELNRIHSATRYPAGGPVTTVYAYDGAGRTLTQTVTGGALTQTSGTTFDGAGRLHTATDTAGRTTTTTYSADGLTTTVTRPGGITEITTRYLDGRTKSVTGTGVVARYYTYGVNADGTQWTQVNLVALDSPQFDRTITDALGRNIRIEKPGYSGLEIAESFYNTKGQLVRTTASGQADTHYAYDALGSQIQSGLDVDATGSLEAASVDRITETETRYTYLEGAWWQESVSRVYATFNDPTATTTSVQRQQLSNLGGGVIGRSVAIDIHGGRTETTTHLNPAGQTETVTTDHPDSSLNAIAITTGGLLISTTTKSGKTTTFGYDALGRRITTTCPRTGTATTHYDDLGQVDWVENAAGNRTSFVYDPATGRKLQETGALTKTTYFAYNTKGQVTHTWGQTPYPVRYLYDAYGRMSQMHTYRTTAGFDQASFPETATGDITTWHYQDATNLLTSKEYADGSEVTYTYHPGGRLHTRTWARGTTTTYTFDPATGELTTIDYSDATADITFTYDRLGRQSEITDALGTRSFAYNDTFQPASETMSGLFNASLTRSYDSSAVPGRSTGFSLDAGYQVTYGYEGATGRFNTLSWNAAGQTDTTTYTYVPDSDLLAGRTTASGLAVTNSYETNRNLRTGVENAFNTALVSNYTYAYDELGRRTSVTNSGSAFVQAAFSRYDYNDRSELTGADRYLGADIQDLSQPVTAEQRAFAYDPIGNRTTSEAAGAATTYATNMLNQYTGLTGAMAYSPAYDADGNLETAPDGRRYTYNGENRLIVAQPETPTEGDTRVEFVYDYMGRRVQKIVYAYGSGAWHLQKEMLFIYDGWNVIKEITRQGGSDTSRYFVWGLDLSQSLQGAGGVGGLLAMVDGANTYHYCFDANGNVGQLVNAANGDIAAHYEFDPFGNVVQQSGGMADDNPFRFSTKYFDQETKLYYYGYRYYSSELGRWISRDPLEEDGGINVYSAFYADPINSLDPLGMFSFKGFANGIWAILKEPVLQVQDISIISMVVINNAVSDTQINPGWVEFKSMLGNRQNSRALQGQGTFESSAKGVGEVIGNIFTGGGLGTGQNIYENVTAYNRGEITLEQMDYNLSMGAGAQFGATVTAIGLSRTTGSGWTGRGPSSNPLIEQQMVQNLIQARQAAGKSNVGNATFAQGQGAEGTTPVFESIAYEMSFRANHAEPQVLNQLRGTGARTIAVDQVPCVTCSLRLFISGLNGTTKVIGPLNPVDSMMSPKSVAVKAAQGTIPSVDVQTYGVYTYKVILNCTTPENKK